MEPHRTATSSRIIILQCMSAQLDRFAKMRRIGPGHSDWNVVVRQEWFLRCGLLGLILSLSL